MAITRQMTGNISVLTVGGGSIIASASNVVVTCPADFVEGRGISYRGKNPQAVGQEVIIRTTQYSNIDTCTRVASVDVGAFTLGGTDFLTHLMGGEFNASHEMVDLGGVSNYWKYNFPTIPDYNANVRLSLPNADSVNAVRTFLGGFMHATIATAIANRYIALSLTINSVATTINMLCQDVQWSGEDGQPQIVTLSLQGKDCNAAAYPTAPTGSTSLLEKAFTVPGTPVAVVFTPKSANSTAFAGDFIFDTFGFGFNKRSLIGTDYQWRSHGLVTPTNN